MVIRSAKPADLWPVKHLIEVLEETVFDERDFTAAFDPHAAHTPSIAKLRRGLVSILQDRRLASRQ